VIVPVFKTGGRRVTPSPVGSTPTRFRHFSLNRHCNHFCNQLARNPLECAAIQFERLGGDDAVPLLAAEIVYRA
jgi:hypothetical protein